MGDSSRPSACDEPARASRQGPCGTSCVAVGAVPVLSKDASSGERGRRSSQVKTPHNPLDSSAPLMKKGKQRETPKAKKPTSLKKVCALLPRKQDTEDWGTLPVCLPFSALLSSHCSGE